MKNAILVLALTACGASPSPTGAPASESSGPTAESTSVPVEELCLPLVSGCGCALLCARAVRHVGGQSYEISHAGQDSRLDIAQRERTCFDERGVSSPAGADGEGTQCMDTFRWGECGGECIPSPVPNCRFVEGSCRAD